MQQRYAICQYVLRSGSLETDLAWAAAAGAAAVGLDVDSIRSTGVDQTADLLGQHGLAVSSLFQGVGRVLDDGTSLDEAEDVVRSIVALAGRLGSRAIMVTTGPRSGRPVAAADKACAAWFARMAPIAADAGVVLALEPVLPLMGHISYVHTLRHAAELTEGRPGTALVADTGHLWWDRRVLDDLAALCSQIATVQVDDVDGEALVDNAYRRVQLGDGVVPLQELLAALEASGYAGYYENEVIARVPRDERAAFVRLGGERLAALLALHSTGRT